MTNNAQPEIPAVGADERGTLTFLWNQLNGEIEAVGGGWNVAAVDANGTNPRSLTDESNSVSDFAWSPDGKQIAYSLSIYEGINQTFGGIPNYDSLGDMLAGIQDFHAKMLDLASDPEAIHSAFTPTTQLCIANADGSDPQCFDNGTFPNWSPDGTRLAIVASDGDTYQIDVINRDGTERGILATGTAPDFVSYPRWSPDGSRIVYLDGGLSLIQPDGSGQQALPLGDLRPTLPEWSPDGTRIAFIAYEDDEGGVYVINGDGTDLRKLAPIDNFDDVGISWSPDSTQIAFVSFPPDNEDFAEGEALWVVAADGQSAPRRLADIYGPEADSGELNVDAPAWSPDGGRIAFLALYDPDSISHDVYLINPDGSDMRRVTTDGDLKLHLAWQPPA